MDFCALHRDSFVQTPGSIFPEAPSTVAAVEVVSYELTQLSCFLNFGAMNDKTQ